MAAPTPTYSAAPAPGTTTTTTTTNSSSSSSNSASTSKFDEGSFLRSLVQLKDTQDAVQGLSAWCLRHRRAAFKIARCWLKVVKKVRTEHKLPLVYLLNDVCQHARRKNYSDLLSRFQSVIKEALPYIRDENICEKVMRVLNIWKDRCVFPDGFMTEILAMMDASADKNDLDQEIVDNFQPQHLCTQIKIMKALEDDTEFKSQAIKDSAALRQSLKDREHGEEITSKVDESAKHFEQYIKALEREISKRRQGRLCICNVLLVIDLLNQGSKYYESLEEEANIVATAYENFEVRIENQSDKLKNKLPELVKKQQQKSITTSNSPIPSPDYNAPSPQADEMELELPDESEEAPKIIVMEPPPLPPPPPIQQEGPGGHRRGSPPMYNPSIDLNSRLDSMMSSNSIPSEIWTQSEREPPPKHHQHHHHHNHSNGGSSRARYERGSNMSGNRVTEEQQRLSQVTGSGSGRSDWWSDSSAQQTAQDEWPEHQQQQETTYDPAVSAVNASSSEPIPEWQLIPVDDEPPEENEVLAHLQGPPPPPPPEDFSRPPPLMNRPPRITGGGNSDAAAGSSSLQDRLRSLARTSTVKSGFGDSKMPPLPPQPKFPNERLQRGSGDHRDFYQQHQHRGPGGPIRGPPVFSGSHVRGGPYQHHQHQHQHHRGGGRGRGGGAPPPPRW